MRQNIVVFFSDQQRYDTLGCNGQPLDVTPNLDRFAAEAATNFANAFTPQPVCGPARAVLQTGRYATQTGCFRNGIPLPQDEKTLAKAMREAGYNVAYVGKWHLASDPDVDGCNFDTTPVPLERRGGYNGYWAAADILEFTSHGYGGYLFDKDCNKLEFEGFRVDCVTDYALCFIEEYDDSKPFFLFISNIEPHHQNDRNRFEGPVGSKEKYGDFMPPPDLPEGQGDWQTAMPDYLGCCNSLDYNFGRVLDALRKKGLYDDTLVIYTSDHGCHFRTRSLEAVGGGADDYKRNSYENTIHIPLLIKGEGFCPGHREEKLVSLIDLPRTIMSAAGYPMGTEIQGRSLQNIEDTQWRNAIYVQISESYVGRAVRTDRYKYVVYAPDKDPWMDSGSDCYQERYLFDLEADPLELSNLLGDHAYEDVRSQMKDLLFALAKEAGEAAFAIVSAP